MADYYLAIDLGASSGRHVLCHAEDGKLVLEEVYRFDNLQVRRGGHNCWDDESIWNHILSGLKKCKEIGKIPKSVGVDTWGVDYVLLDKEGNKIGDAVAYRDSRTVGMDSVVEEKIPFRRLYERTGIQKASYNTIYQLTALQREHPEQMRKADCLLMSPDYYHYLLTGVKMNEYAIATTSSLVNAREKNWDKELIASLGLPTGIFRDLRMPGTKVGNFRAEVREEVGFDAQVILPASHDTGSAFLTIPAVDDNAVYISSGTWSLLGVENDRPITTEESCRLNFTNEGGAWSRYRFIKNIMGLWMIQSVRRELNGVDYVQGKNGRKAAAKQWSFQELSAEAQAETAFCSIVNVNSERFLAPESMVQAVKDECRETGQQVPQTIGELMRCIYMSLALCYRDAIQELQGLTGKKYTSINIVGGGCQDEYLNRLTAAATGLPVYAGPVEGTAIGNVLVQMITDGKIDSLSAARDMVRKSFQITPVEA